MLVGAGCTSPNVTESSVSLSSLHSLSGCEQNLLAAVVHIAAAVHQDRVCQLVGLSLAGSDELVKHHFLGASGGGPALQTVRQDRQGVPHAFAVRSSMGQHGQHC